MMARRIGKLVDSGLHGSDVTLSWLMRRIQSLQFRTRLLCQFTGMTDPMCVTPASLPNDSVSRRIRQLMKIQKPCSDVEPAIDAYSAQNECPRVSSWLIKTSCLISFILHAKFFFPFSSQLVALGPRELGDWEKPKPEPK